MLPDLLSDLGATIQSMGSDSSLPNLLVPCTHQCRLQQTAHVNFEMNIQRAQHVDIVLSSQDV